MPRTAAFVTAMGQSRDVQLVKMTSVQFSVVLQKNCSFWFGWGFTKTIVVPFFGQVFCTACCLTCMLEMMYYSAKLVQLTVSQSDSELEVQIYRIKKYF